MDRFCPVCGRKQKSSAKYCNECGANMSPSATRKVELLDDRYQVESILKSGNMGCVYRAVDTRLGETVAVKKMQSAYNLDADGKKFQEMFLREAKLLAKLHHGGLPKVTDYFTEKDSGGKTSHYLVMTFIEGMDMECYLRQNIPPLPLDEAMGYFRQILDIFSYLHSQTPPVIYRDLKPSNIIIKEGKLYLVDFGIAKILKPLQKGTMWGTQGYASPDQCRGNDSPLNDIYSLGVLIHYFLTGLDPEDPSRPLFTFEPVRNFNKDAPGFLDDLIMSMVDISSINRPGSVDGIIEILDGGGGRYPGNAHTSAHAPVPSHPSHFPKKAFDRYDEFLEAVKNGRTAEVEEYINQGADVNAKDNYNYTPLHFATFNGHTDIVKLFISRGADVNAKDFYGMTPLKYAASEGKTDTAKLLISKGADVNAKDKDGWAPLHYAAIHGHTDFIRLLISKGADVNEKDNDGWTPLHHALYNNHTDTTKLLIHKGADVNEKNNDGKTPLQFAKSGSSAEITKLLGGENSDKKVSRKRTPWGLLALSFIIVIAFIFASFLFSKRANINVKDSYGRTSLHNAASLGKTKTAKLLISKGADVNAMDNYSQTPLHKAVKYGKINTAKLLISKGANVNAKDNYGQTPLHKAAFYGKTNTAKLLIFKGANINVKDNYGQTPLYKAEKYSHTDIVNLLRKHGAR